MRIYYLIIIVLITLTVYCNVNSSRSSVLPLSNQSGGLEIIYPNGGETLSGVETIQWEFTSAYDENTISYSLFYSPDNGQNWIQLGLYIQSTSSLWNTSLYETYGTKFLIKVCAEIKEFGNIEDISDSNFIIDNREDKTYEDLSFLGLIALITIISSTAIGYYLYNTKLKKDDVIGIFYSNKMEYLKAIRHKVIIGLDNIKSGFIDEPLDIPLLIPRVSPASMIEYFPSNIQYELRSEIKGKTLLTLIEIAYQDPGDTNPAKLAKSLNIPLPTLSKEIKKLRELCYVETYISNQVIQDGRYRNFKITSKGYQFLSILNNTLKVTINRLKKNGQIDSHYLI